ncbi:MAG: hypothetical protein IJM98_07535 [Oscillospiraceae bacterium]|nr:hypothetical protein [Oscillospiraceae bacterium]
MSTVLKNKNSRARNSSFKKLLFALTGIFALLFAASLVLQFSSENKAYLTLSITFGVTLYHFAIRLVIGYLTDKIFRGKTNPKSKWFSPKKFEHRMYKMLKVHKWKKFVPTFDPNQFNMEDNSLNKIADSMCVAELCHEIIILFAFLPVLLIIPFGSSGVFITTSFVSACIDFIFVIIQRYNRPRILRLIERKA